MLPSITECIRVSSHHRRRHTSNLYEISANFLTNFKPVAEHCTTLQTLVVSWCREITDVGIISIAQKCVCLETIDVSWCKKITGNQPATCHGVNSPLFRWKREGNCEQLQVDQSNEFFMLYVTYRRIHQCYHYESSHSVQREHFSGLYWMREHLYWLL
jgi:hypothetical protein